jgi:hypothetical protein
MWLEVRPLHQGRSPLLELAAWVRRRRRPTTMILLGALCAAVMSAPAAASASRRVGWWWDAPSTAADPKVDALLGFAKNHTSIVASVMMLCGPTTKTGAVVGELLPSCARAIPALEKLGVDSELWLGETDSYNNSQLLFADPAKTVEALTKLGKDYPGIKGFNFDMEVGGSECKGAHCATGYAAFLSAVRTGLQATGRKYRITADTACAAGASGGWAPMIGSCAVLATGADKILNMETYNAVSWEAWMAQLKPALQPGVPLEKLGAGLGW